MSRALRAARTRWHLLVATGLVAGIAVAGPALCTPGDDPARGTELAGPVLLLAVVALAACARETVAARRPEIRLVRLRGVHGARLVGFLAAEPFVVLAVGGACGLAVAGGSRALAGGTVPWSALVLLACGIVLAATAVLVGLLLVDAVAPLGRHLRDRHPVVGAVPGGTVSLVLVFVCAAVVTQRSLADGDEGPEWLLLLGPAVLGLVAGQVALWLLRGIGTVAAARPAAGTAGFLAARRVARLADGVDGVRILVAGAVVAVVALTGTTSVSSWVDETAALRVGAPQQVTVEDGALAALRLTRTLDPEGRWLMAAELTTGEGVATQALVDTARYRRVVGEHLRDTRASGVAGHLDELAPADSTPVVQVATGSRLRVEVEGPRGAGAPVRVTVGYLNDEDYTEEARVRVEPGGDAATRRLPRCADGCAVASLRVDGPAGSSYRFTGLDFGGVDLTAVPWRGTGAAAEPMDAGDLSLSTGDRGSVEAAPGTEPVPVVRAGEGRAALVDGNGETRPVSVVGTSAALPLAQGEGTLGDLPRTLAVATPSAVASRAMVLARADTPPEVRDALTEATGSPLRDADDFRSDSRDDLGAGKDHASLLAGMLCLGLTVPVLLARRRRVRSESRRDAGALRLVGLTATVLRAAVRREQAAAVTGLAVLVVAAGAGAVWLLAPALLPEPPGGAVPLEAAPRLLPLLVVAAVAACLWLVLVVPARRPGRARSVPVELVGGDDRD